jgi:hypothetical protein
VAYPDVIVELGQEKFTATAEVASEPERTTLYRQLKKEYPGFADYEKKTSRIIPVIKLKRH